MDTLGEAMPTERTKQKSRTKHSKVTYLCTERACTESACRERMPRSHLATEIPQSVPTVTEHSEAVADPPPTARCAGETQPGAQEAARQGEQRPSCAVRVCGQRGVVRANMSESGRNRGGVPARTAYTRVTRPLSDTQVMGAKHKERRKGIN